MIQFSGNLFREDSLMAHFESVKSELNVVISGTPDPSLKEANGIYQILGSLVPKKGTQCGSGRACNCTAMSFVGNRVTKWGIIESN